MKTLGFPAPRAASRPTDSPVIETERLILRPPRRGDERAIIDYYERNRAFLSPWEPEKPSDFYTFAFWAEQVDVIKKECKGNTAVRFFLFPRRHSEQVVGYISYTQIIQKAAWYCVLGYSLGADAQGQGYMAEALSASNQWVFDNLHLHRIMANYMPHNRRSGNLLRRLGFSVEGYARDYLLINGKWQDHILTALTNPNWKRPD